MGQEDDDLVVLAAVRDATELVCWSDLRRACRLDSVTMENVARRLLEARLVTLTGAHEAFVALTPSGHDRIALRDRGRHE
jgi:RIO-like serine/threonine protein kinase